MFTYEGDGVLSKQLGVYIHIPFCASKCAYCNFYSITGNDALMRAYQDAVIKHITECSLQLEEYLVDTVYFGGGTPSHYGTDRLVGILDALKKHNRIAPDPEVTVEINPGDAAIADLLKLRSAGFNRVSIGIQCADDLILKSLGRRHTFEDAKETVIIARRAGFDNISADLIYGLPAQDMESWADTIAKTTALEVEHISFYGLKVEEGTQLYQTKDSAHLPDDDAQADMYLYAVETLARHGYSQYEISNASRLRYESKHNMKYWLGDDYIGFGPGAHSYTQGRRFSYLEDVAEYIKRVTAGQEVADCCEELSDFARAEEYLMLRLRTTFGISEKEYYDNFGWKLYMILELLRKYESNGWAVSEDGRWRFTPGGFILSNTLIGEILEAHAKQRT